MGTSQSNPGPNGRSPLVPPWADDEPDKPLPPPPDRRFQTFRYHLGKFVQNGNSSNLRSALGSYARRGYGGGSIAGRRLGSVSKSGAGLFNALSQGQVSSTSGDTSLDLSTLSGIPCQTAINTIAQFLAPQNGDSAKIHAAINNALVEALDGIAVFDMSQITDEVIVNTMIGYMSESIFLLIVGDGGKAWTKAKTSMQQIRAENSLRELVKVIVDRKMASKLQGNIRAISQADMMIIQRQVIADVWTEWEKYS